MPTAFVSLRQREQASLIGMWVFIAQELLFFAGLFLTYAVMRWAYPATFLAAHRKLNVTLGTINTAVLLVSSYSAALAVLASRARRSRMHAALLLCTATLGCVFLGIKGLEYAEKFREGLLPGALYRGVGLPGKPDVFFGLYFAMTGLHALHVLIGIALFAWQALAVVRVRARDDAALTNTTHNLALYWHFVDLVWIFLFPLLYLIR
jgi:cytochrome c oxidase subunit III